MVIKFWSIPNKLCYLKIIIYERLRKEDSPMEIAKNSRQMPSMKSIVKEKNYCDLLYAWV
jgi:hypothetical protein